MVDFKKAVFVILLVLLGILLILAGVNLIQISQSLLLYSGIGLVALAVAYYLLN